MLIQSAMKRGSTRGVGTKGRKVLRRGLQHELLTMMDLLNGLGWITQAKAWHKAMASMMT